MLKKTILIILITMTICIAISNVNAVNLDNIKNNTIIKVDNENITATYKVIKNNNNTLTVQTLKRIDKNPLKHLINQPNTIKIQKPTKKQQYNIFLRADLKKIKKINKKLMNKKYTKHTKNIQKTKRNYLIAKNYYIMIKNSWYNSFSKKYGLDWEC